MSNIDIENLWNDDQKSAKDHFNSIENEILTRAKSKSKNILQTLKRKIAMEWIFVALVLVWVMFDARDHRYFNEAIIFFAVVTIISIPPYFNLFKRISNTTTDNLTNCLQAYVQILGSFIRITRIMYFIMLPICLVFGFALGLSSHRDFNFQDMPSNMIYVSIGLLSIMCLLMYLFTEKVYIPMMYEKHKKEFERLLDNLL